MLYLWYLLSCALQICIQVDYMLSLHTGKKLSTKEALIWSRDSSKAFVKMIVL